MQIVEARFLCFDCKETFFLDIIEDYYSRGERAFDPEYEFVKEDRCPNCGSYDIDIMETY